MTEVQTPPILNYPSPPGRRSPLALVRRLMGSQLRINVLSGVASTGVNVMVLAISIPLYLHFLGYEKVGVWSLLSSVQMFAQLGLMGIGPALTKLVAEECGRKDTAGAQKYLSLATSILITTGTLALLTLWIFEKPVAAGLGLTGEDAALGLKLLPYVGMLTAFSFLNQVSTAGLAGLGRMDMANYLMTGGKIFALALETTLLWNGFGVVTLLIGDVAGCMVIHVGGIIYLRRAGLRMIRADFWDRERFARLMGFGGTVFVSSLTTLLVAPLNKLGLAHYAGVAAVPVYDIAVNGSMQLRGLAEVGLRALMPAVSHKLAAGTPEARQDVRRLYFRSVKFLLLVVPIAYLAALLLDGPLLKLWLGSRFVPELVPTLNILLASAGISLLAVPAYFTLMGAGHARSCMVSHLLAALVNVLWMGSLMFVQHRCTLNGASVSVLLSTIVSSGYLVIENHRELARNEDDKVRE